MARTPPRRTPHKIKHCFLSGRCRLALTADFAFPKSAEGWSSEGGVMGQPGGEGDSPPAEGRQGKDGRVTKILVAEDEPDIRQLLKFALSFTGYHVIPATDGQMAY